MPRHRNPTYKICESSRRKKRLIAGRRPDRKPAYVDAIEAAGEVGFDMALNTNAVLLTEET